jgi:uncharacterized membrane protein
MKSQPELISEKTHSDKVLEIAAWALLIVLIGFTIFAYVQMPETVPVHFNIKGDPDRYGGKSTIFLLAGIGVALVALFMFLLKSPGNYSKYNYPIKVTPEHQAKVYALSARLMRVIMVNILIMFLFITVEIFLIATGKIESTGVWSVILMILLPIAPVAYYLRRMMKLR